MEIPEGLLIMDTTKPTNYKGLLVLFGFAIVIFMLVILFSMFNVIDASRDVAVAHYEECIQSQYNMTPIAYMQQHGEYPDCTK